MRNLFQVITVIFLFVLTNTANAESNRGSRMDAVAMVQKAALYMQAHGKEQTYAEANNPNGQFTRGDLYIAITGLDGYAYANGGNVRLVGRNLIDIRDADGKYIQRERIDIARNKGKGWQDYKWVNPLTQKLEVKSMYFETVDGVVIACGVYNDALAENQTAVVAGL